MRPLLLFIAAAACASAAEIRIGIIGTDTSHVPAFTRLLNGAPGDADHVAGARVVAAFRGGSPDIESSAGRVEQYAREIHEKWGVEIVPDIATLVARVDAVLLSSVDGRVHLAQAREAIAAGKPLFIDKPLAATLEDAREIARLAQAAGVRWFSASSLRFGAIGAGVRRAGVRGAMTWGPGPLEPHHYLDLSWYAVHPVELLYAVMGQGCESVTRTYTEGADEVVGTWRDGRIGSVRALRPYGDYGAIAFYDKETVVSHPAAAAAADYRPLVERIVRFFEGGPAPVENEETLEMFAFMDAAQKSRERGGAPVRLR